MRLHARRSRLVWRVFTAGVLAGIVAAAVVGLMGFDGRVGFGSLLLFTTLGAVSAAVIAAVLAIVDEARQDAVSRGRIVQIVGMFVVAVLGLLLLFGLAGAGP